MVQNVYFDNEFKQVNISLSQTDLFDPCVGLLIDMVNAAASHLIHTCTTAINTYKVVLFTNPSARAGYDTRSIFKRSLTGLNSEFSFS